VSDITGGDGSALVYQGAVANLIESQAAEIANLQRTLDKQCQVSTLVVEALKAERDALRDVASQVLRDMQAQGVLLEWHTVLSDALAARAQEPK
jgi:hypothetical protein